MQDLVPRNIEEFVIQNLSLFPAVVILGPRQCGKSTLVKMLAPRFSRFVYLDLQNTDDRNKLTEPMLFFEANKDSVICLDEIQFQPDIFSTLRSFIDKNRQKGQFILLGSASRDLVQHTSESLAGRVGIIDLTPFTVYEVYNRPEYSLNSHWFRGGFPESFLANSDSDSKLWIDNFIRTFIERDIPQFGFQIPSVQLRRFLMMSAHNQGQVLNASKLGESLGLTHPTIRRYIDLMEQTFIMRSVPPYLVNMKKRLVKSPKVFIRDSGLLHRLLSIDDFNSLMGHPVFGFSWEGFVIENIITRMRDWEYYFYRASTGDEIDLILVKGMKIIAVECKASSAPGLSRRNWNAVEEVKPEKVFIVSPVTGSYQIAQNCIVCSLEHFLGLPL
jgi:predicted AAA+ superfamily ATPase